MTSIEVDAGAHLHGSTHWASMERMMHVGGAPGQSDPVEVVILTVISAELDASPAARSLILVRRGGQVTIAVPLFREWIRMNIM